MVERSTGKTQAKGLFHIPGLLQSVDWPWSSAAAEKHRPKAYSTWGLTNKQL